MMKKLISAGLISASILFASPALAALHPLTKAVDDPVTVTTYIDQVVAIDWDVNNPPMLEINGINTPLDKAYLLEVMNSASDLLYTMTEGKLRLGKISVYRNQYLDNADILILNKDGRANANLNGLNIEGARCQMFTIGFGTAYTGFGLGQVIAHEFGHYMLGMYDEYREAGQMDTSSAGRPQDRDTPRDTIMNDQSQFSNLSIPGDYADPLQRQTSHYRVFGQSAWETLISDPKNDPATPGYNLRTQFNAFKNMAAPATLAKPVNSTASRASIQMTYMNGSRAVIVIDLGVTQTELAGLIRAAETVVDAVDNGSQVAVLTVSGAQFNTPVALTTLGEGAADPTRVAVKAALAALTPVESAAGGLDSTLLQAAIIASPLAAAQDAASKSGIAAPLSNTIEISQTPIISLFTTISANVTSATTQTLAQGGVMLNPLVLNNSAGTATSNGMLAGKQHTVANQRMRALASNAMAGNMDVLAKATNGRMVETRSATDLAQKSTQVMNETEGDMLQIVTAATAESLAAGAALTMPTPIASSAIDGEVTFIAYLGGNTGMNLTLTSPAGTVINSTNAAALGITFESIAEEGIQLYTIPASFSGRAGNWIATVTALTASTEPIDMEASVASQLTVKSSIYGGTLADTRPPVLSAILTQPLAVKNATVTASVYDINQALVKDGIILKDDGVSPDARSGDGMYTASLAGIISALGEYEVDIHISNEGLKAAYGTTGSRIAGANLPDVPITQNFLRDDFISYNLKVAGTSTTPYMGLWYNPAESGWGMSVTQHGSMNFVAAYTYDQTGQPTWYVMSSCPVIGSGCTGDLYAVTGGTLPTSAWSGSGIKVNKVGTGTLAFVNTDNGTFNFTINGSSGTKAISRQVFAASGTQSAVNYTDLWWNASESGWGVALTHQFSTIFVTWYAYDASGKAIWYVASNCAVSGNGCTGDLYQVTGGSMPTVTWNGANKVVAKVGAVSFTFTDASTGTMTYTINGAEGSKAITRQLF